MLGIDITKISRFIKPKKTLINRILHTKEIEEYNNIEDKPKFLASRWAIKESLYKSDPTNKKFSKIHIKKKNDKYIYPGYLISTSTEGDYYIAVVIKGK